MKHKWYLPSSDEDRVLFLNNFALKKAVHKTTLGFSNAEVTATENDALMFSFLVNTINELKRDMQEIVKYKDLLRDGPRGTPLGAFPSFTSTSGAVVPTLVPADIFLRVSQDVKRIKGSPNYTTAIGEDMGIIGPVDSFNADTYKPIIKAKAFNGYVRIAFVKQDVAIDRVNIYTRFKGQSIWVFLSTATLSPYNDSRPLNDDVPETREYMVRGVVNDAEVGLNSDIVSVLFGG
jgi:hypothetical protein